MWEVLTIPRRHLHRAFYFLTLHIWRFQLFRHKRGLMTLSTSTISTNLGTEMDNSFDETTSPPFNTSNVEQSEIIETNSSDSITSLTESEANGFEIIASTSVSCSTVAGTNETESSVKRDNELSGIGFITKQILRFSARSENDTSTSSSSSTSQKQNQSISLTSCKEDMKQIVTEDQLKANRDKVIQRVRTVLSNDENANKELGLSLSGCGFLGSYHFGVIICFHKNATKLLSRITHVAGSSVGSLVAALITLAPEYIEDGLKQLYALAEEINAYSMGAMAPKFYLAERLPLIVDKFLPLDIMPANGRLHVSLTKQNTYQNRMVSQFPSREYLMRCLNASCYIPLYSMGYFAEPPKIDDEYYLDGGYSNNLPIFDNIPTITISPFSGSAIIAPVDRSLFDWRMRLGNQVMKVNLQNVKRGAQALFPPSTSGLKGYYEMGYRDAMKFLVENDFIEREEGTEL